MTAAELQAELAERGCVLWVEGEMLRFRAPDGALTPPLMRQLKRHKKELIERLREESRSGGRSTHAQEPSFGQQAMYLLHEAVPDSPAYNVASAVKLTSPVDFEALRRVWRTLVARHDSLRTTFENCAGRLVARVHDEAVVDIENIPACGENDDQVRERVVRDYRRPFDLAAGPLARLRLYSTAPDRHVLLMSMHHIVLDAWSLWVLHDELGELYRQEAAGEVGMLPATGTTYEEFVRWQQEMPNTEQGRQQWGYWKEQLSGDPSPAHVPWDRPRPATMQQQGASLHFRLPEELAGQLRELGRTRGATPFVTLLSVFQAVLHRHSGQSDFLVGTTTSGRSSKQFSRLVGYLVNTLPLRTTIKPGARFSDLLEQSRDATLGGMAAQDFPFPLMVERLNPPREAGALPLCRVMFGLQKPHDFSEAMQALDDAEQSIDWGGLRASAFALDQQEGQFDLTLEMYETTSTYLGVLKYDPNLLDRESAEAIAARYEHAARQLVDNPELPLDELELVTPEERQQLAGWSAPAIGGEPSGMRIEELFRESARRAPEQAAIVEGQRRLSYQQVEAQTNRIAAWMGERGVGRGDVVGCCLTRGADAWLAMLACWKAGAVYVPLDDAGPTRRLCSLLEDCDARLLLSDTTVAHRLDLASAELPVALELLDEAADEIARQGADAAPVAGDPSDDAYIIYTSGSTGAPKGVVVTHEAFAWHLRRVQAEFQTTGSDRVMQFSAMTFDPSLEQAWTAWSVGATLVVRGPELWSASEFWAVVQQQGVTVANLPPAYFRECSESMTEGAADNLRLMIVGGDAFPADSLTPWRSAPTRILNAYGPTEVVVTATVAEMNGYDPSQGRAPIGRPLPGTRAWVVDADDRPQPIGVPGELLLGGPMLASRYLKDDKLTAERFRAASMLTGDEQPIYRTGDLVRWNHRGQLEFLGRMDRQVKVCGYRIELGEVERLLESIAGVHTAVALVQQQGAAEPRLVAYYSTDCGQPAPQAELFASIRARAPHYMTPSALVHVAEFPLNASGKIAVKKLPEAPLTAAQSTREYVAPTSSLQKILADVWAEVLGVERVGIHDDFFELGGASLKSLQIVSAAEARGVRLADAALSPALLFEYPTIAQLAELLVHSEETIAAGG